jgi:hypothetical protein
MKPARSIDWRGWLAVAWALTFAVLYGKMVAEQRGGKIRAAISSARDPSSNRAVNR